MYMYIHVSLHGAFFTAHFIEQVFFFHIYLLLEKSLDLKAVTYKQAKRRVFLQENDIFPKPLPFGCKSHFQKENRDTARALSNEI